MCWSAKNNGTNTIYIYKCRYTFSVILYIFFGYKHILWGMAFLHENICQVKEVNPFEMDLSKIRLVCQLKSNVTKLKKDSWISMFTSNIKQDKHCF
jgi:hypothetical protein